MNTKSLPYRFIIYCSTHYFRLLGLSVIILLAVSGHRVFPFLTHPVVVSGVTTQPTTVYSIGGGGYTRFGSKRSPTDVLAPGVDFVYEGKPYHITGGWDEEKNGGIPTTVIFNKSHPEKAAECTFLGLIDFRIFFRLGIPLWILLSGALLAEASRDKNFDAFDFSLKKLSLSWFLVLVALFFLVPLIPSMPILVLGKKTVGQITDQNVYLKGGGIRRAISYEVNGIKYISAAQGKYDEDDYMIGRHIPMIYDRAAPENASINDLQVLYSNNWIAITFMGWLFLIAWFIACRQ